MGLLYWRAGRLTAPNGGFRPGQPSISLAAAVFEATENGHIRESADCRLHVDAFKHAHAVRLLEAGIRFPGWGAPSHGR